MTDLSSYLRPSARNTMPPALLPAATYPGIIRGSEVSAVGANQTPALRIQLSIDTRDPKTKGWPEDIAEASKFQSGPDGEQFPIDLETVRFRKDFFLTPAAYFRLENFLVAMGFTIQTDSEGNKDYEPAVNDLNGRTVAIEVQMLRSNRTNELINVVNDIYPRNR